MKRKPSIHDIARELNVSAIAISFVLNGKAKEKRVSEELENKILNYVNKVGYSPNLIAKSLRTGKSNIIGMLVEDISDPFFSSITRNIETQAFQLGYKVFEFHHGEIGKTFKFLIKSAPVTLDNIHKPKMR